MGLKQYILATTCGVSLLWMGHGMAQVREVGQSLALPSTVPPGVQTPCVDKPARTDKELQEHEVCVLHAQVQKALEQQQWLEVELLLERILMYKPNDAQAMLQLAMVLAVRDRTASAKALLRRCATMNALQRGTVCACRPCWITKISGHPRKR